MSEETQTKPRQQENQIFFQGNLGADPELKYFESGVAYCIFDLANSDDYLDGEKERVERTHWSPIYTQGKLAEACAEYLKKGSEAMVTRGKLVQRKWTNEAGENRSRLQIHALKVLFLRGNGNGGRNSEETPPDTPEDDIPF